MRITRIPVPLLLAAVVAVGITVTLIIHVVILEPIPAIVFPLLFGPEETLTSHVLTIEAQPGDEVNYATIASIGRVELLTNTTGWRYKAFRTLGSVVLRTPGDYVFTVPLDQFNVTVVVRDLNQTHAIVAATAAHERANATYAFITTKVKFAQWYVYHPVVANINDDLVQILQDIRTSLNRVYLCVVQPSQDRVEIDAANEIVYIKCDMVTDTGFFPGAARLMVSGFTTIEPNTPVKLDYAVKYNNVGYYIYTAVVYLKESFYTTTATAISVTPTG